jgi:protein involved in polysaccharide export with SLBB domain
MKKNTIFIVLFLTLSSYAFSKIPENQMEMLEQLPPDQRASILDKMESSQGLKDELEDFFEKESSLIRRPELPEEKENQDKYKAGECEDCIYGYEYFKFSPTTFAPIDNSPVPADYIIGPGDLLEISLYGNDNLDTKQYVSREGEVFIPKLGPVLLVGYTIDEANEILNKKVEQSLIGTEITVTLKELRSISIYLLGEAYKPGQYTVSGLSSVTNALFVSGGVNRFGSLRNIQIKRDYKVIGIYDFYDFILKGNAKSDIRLLDGDVIFIPFIENRVRMGGAFKRPAIYEFKMGETVTDAIKLAGGYTSMVPPNPALEISYIEKKDFVRKLITSDDLEILGRTLLNEDSINVSSLSGMNSEIIKLSGEVKKPGDYFIQRGETILDVIKRAGGYTDQSYPEGAVYLRKEVARMQKLAFERSADELENTIIEIITKGTVKNFNEFTLAPISTLIRKLRSTEPLGRMVVDVDFLNLKTNISNNFLAQGGDSLYIPKRPNSVSIVGEVLNSSTLTFQPNFNVNNYIDFAGGLNSAADKTRIFVIYPDGRSELTKRTLFSSSNTLIPGSTIVIPRDSRPFDAFQITSIITPILADLATSAAAIAAISKD